MIGTISVHIAGASEHIAFLRTIHVHGISLSKPSRESLRRYTQLWLPLVAANMGKQLVPPGDIAWLWHCHRLAPGRYTKYVNMRFGVLALEAHPAFSLQVEGTEHPPTIQLWEDAFGPAEPFMLSSAVEWPVCDEDADGLLAGFDLIGSCERQTSFLWQVSGVRFNDPEFLVEAQTNYFKFLCLNKFKNRKQVIVPTYQIDLMWHTHILTSVEKYNEDCIAISGATLHHDDSLNDRCLINRLLFALALITVPIQILRFRSWQVSRFRS